MTSGSELRQEYKLKVYKCQEDFVKKLLQIHDQKTALIAILNITGVVYREGVMLKRDFKSTGSYEKDLDDIKSEVLAKLDVEKLRRNTIDYEPYDEYFDFRSDFESSLITYLNHLTLLDIFQKQTKKSINDFGFKINFVTASTMKMTYVELDKFWEELSPETKKVWSIAKKFLYEGVDIEMFRNSVLNVDNSRKYLLLSEELKLDDIQTCNKTQLEQLLDRYVGKPNDKPR